MKRIAIVFLTGLTLIVPKILRTQDVIMTRIDSLNTVLQQQTGADRAASLLALSEAFRLVSFEKTMKSGQEALDYAEAHQLNVLKAQICKSLGQSAQLAGDYDLAYQYFLKSLQLYRNLGDDFNLARLNNMLGNLKTNVSEYDSALFYFEKVSLLASTLNNDSLLAWATINRGNAWFETGRLNEAHDAFYKASIMFGKLGDSINRSFAQMNMSQVLWQWNQNDKAIALLEETMSFARRNGHDEMLSRACSNIGLIYYYDLEDYPTALRYFEEALHIREAEASPVPIAHTLLNIANVYVAQDEVSRAIPLYERAMLIYQAAGAAQGEVRTFYHLGEAYRQMGDFKQSNTQLQNCLHAAEAHGIVTYSSIVRDLMMENFIDLKDFPSFLVQYQSYRQENDSLADAFNNLQASEAEFRQRADELLLLRDQLENENRQLRQRVQVQQYVAGAFTGIMLFSLMIYVLWRRKQRKNQSAKSVFNTI